MTYAASGGPETLIVLYENPELYDALLPVSAEQLDFYISLAQRHVGPVLALACGSGQLIVPIAAAGLPATGLDTSAEMLVAARRRALAEGASVELMEGDMRDFELGRQFSVIFVARNSLLHLSEPDDFAAFFSAVRRHLRPDGVLAFDIFNPDIRMLAQPRGERMYIMRTTSPLHGEITVEATNDYDPSSQVNRATWFISGGEARCVDHSPTLTIDISTGVARSSRDERISSRSAGRRFRWQQLHECEFSAGLSVSTCLMQPPK